VTAKTRARARPRADRRAQILAAAERVVTRNGYASTSMKDIAEEAGVAQALLHYYFESKDELLTEVVMAIDNEVQTAWKVAVAEIDDPLRRIAVALDTAAVKCAERPEFFRLLFDLQAASFTNPAVRARLRALSDHFLEDVIAEVERVAAAMPVAPPMPARALASAIMGSIDGIVFQSLLRRESPRDALQALKAMVLGFAAMSYLAAGEEPPLERLAGLLPPAI
jgi:AcrR family transcriptional regulator